MKGLVASRLALEPDPDPMEPNGDGDETWAAFGDLGTKSFLTVDEAVELLRINRKTLYGHAAQCRTTR